MSEEESRNHTNDEGHDEAPQEQGGKEEDDRSLDELAPATVPRRVKQLIETFGFRSEPIHHPVLRGIGENPDLLGKFLDQSHAHEQHKIWLAAGIGALIVLVIFALCWLFLGYNQTEHLDAIIGGIIGLLGGFGAGWAYGKTMSE